MDKLLIFPGDWHLLKNYQEVLMKQYFHSGLKDNAMETGFKSSTLASLESCSNFRRTHNFLLQVWEAIYRQIIAMSKVNSDNTINESIIDSLSDVLLNAAQINAIFQSHINDKSKQNELLKYWSRFVFDDCFAYVQLYLAIRSGNWNLRLSAIKQMAPLFFAFDQNVYMELIPHHLAELSTYPNEIIECFKQGGFTVSITGVAWCNVALDEAHEMAINKDLKSAVVRPTTEYLQKTSTFFNYRIKLIIQKSHESNFS
jgi:hypothetical protein